MRKKVLPLLMLLALAGMLYAAAVGGLNSHNISVEDEYGRIIPIADIVSIEIFNPGTRTRSTIYKESAKTNAITQPITASSTNTTLVSSQMFWWGPNGYDIKIILTGGVSIIKEGLSSSDGSSSGRNPSTTR